MAKKKDVNYISAKEARAISSRNRKITGQIEKKRNRKHIPAITFWGFAQIYYMNLITILF